MARKYKDPWTRPDLIDEAQRRTKRFIRKIQSLIQKKDFDIILASGNSGIMMAKITEMTYKHLGKKMPPIVKIPIYLRDRMGKRIKFDNSVLITEVQKQIKNIKKIEHILVVDDDLNEKYPKTVIESIKLVNKAGEDKISKRLDVFVVAEGETGKGKLGRVKSLDCNIIYFPFAKETKEWKGISNFVSYGIPWEYQKKIRKFYSDEELEAKKIFCILLREPIRSKGKFKGGKPYFSYKWNSMLKEKIRNFEKLQKGFERHIKNLIREAVKKRVEVTLV